MQIPARVLTSTILTTKKTRALPGEIYVRSNLERKFSMLETTELLRCFSEESCRCCRSRRGHNFLPPGKNLSTWIQITCPWKIEHKDSTLSQLCCARLELILLTSASGSVTAAQRKIYASSKCKNCPRLDKFTLASDSSSVVPTSPAATYLRGSLGRFAAITLPGSEGCERFNIV